MAAYYNLQTDEQVALNLFGELKIRIQAKIETNVKLTVLMVAEMLPHPRKE